MVEKREGRYSVPISEDFEPGSNDQVLKNKLGIKSKMLLEKIETQELDRTQLEIEKIFHVDDILCAQDISDIHTLWLGDIYSFAGYYRSVNMSKGDFHFAPATHIPRLMDEFEKKYLRKYTPCHLSNDNDLATAMGIVHVEFILIHPFREGNGRVSRLVANIMSMQSGRPPLDFTPIDQIINIAGFNNYINAINSGLDENYGPITEIFKRILAISG